MIQLLDEDQFDQENRTLGQREDELVERKKQLEADEKAVTKERQEFDKKWFPN